MKDMNLLKGMILGIEGKTNTTPSSVQKRVLSDVLDCGNSILAVCEGRIPK